MDDDRKVEESGRVEGKYLKGRSKLVNVKVKA